MDSLYKVARFQILSKLQDVNAAFAFRNFELFQQHLTDIVQGTRLFEQDPDPTADVIQGKVATLFDAHDRHFAVDDGRDVAFLLSQDGVEG
jgi:hypothetical protein